MSEVQVIKCQSCIERQLAEPNDAIGLYLDMPICDSCLTPIMANKENIQADSIAITSDKDSLSERKARALSLLDGFYESFDNFPMTAEEVLSARDDFYNHRAPALINMSVDEIKTIINRRKAVLFAIRIKDEQWSTIIEQLKNEARVTAGLTGVAKSIKEKAKKPSEFSNEKAKKLAKMLGISVSQLEAMGADARTTEFAGIIGNDTKEKAVEGNQSAKQSLQNIQSKLSGAESPKARRNPVTGKLME